MSNCVVCRNINYCAEKDKHYGMSKVCVDFAPINISVAGRLRDCVNMNPTSTKVTIKDEVEISINDISKYIKNVIFNPPATIIMWEDGTKTVVKAQEGDTFDPEAGFAMAVIKKAFGNKSSYYDVVKKWCEPYRAKRRKEELDEIRMRFREDMYYNELMMTRDELAKIFNYIRETDGKNDK